MYITKIHRPNKPKDEQAQGRTDSGRTRSGDKGCGYHCANRILI